MRDRTAAAVAATLLPSWEGRSAAEWAERLGVAAAEFHSRIGSTSDRARELAAPGSPVPAVVVADRQTRGRGRRGRRWESDTALGLWFTAAREARRDGRGATAPLLAGLAVARAAESLVPDVRVAVKWPNDVLVRGRKLGGVLCERAGGVVLVGIGVNLNHGRGDLPGGGAAPAGGAQPGRGALPATSLRLESGCAVARGAMLEAVHDRLRGAWARAGSRIPPAELDELNARSALRDRELLVSGAVRDWYRCASVRRGRRGDGSSRGRARVESKVETVERLAVLGGDVLPCGSLEVRDQCGTRLRVVAGSIEIRS